MPNRFLMPVMLSVAAVVTPGSIQLASAEEAACASPAVPIEAEEYTPLTSDNYARTETQATGYSGMELLMPERVPSDPNHKAFARANFGFFCDG
jgi:hypothetical protein